jgi:hypothetical protein
MMQVIYGNIPRREDCRQITNKEDGLDGYLLVVMMQSWQKTAWI